jgi:hypothetical protein
LRIYPDSSDLINLSRGIAGADITDLARRLAAHCHQFVFSLETLIEVAAPLRNGRFLEVRRDLNRLEELPHTFVNEGRIYHLELREAVRAFERGREYDRGQVVPFASRLDEANDIHGAPQYIVEGGRRVPTKMIVNFGIAEGISYLWKYDRNTLDVQRRREQEWIWVMESDRGMASPPALRDHFVTTMVRNLATHGVRAPAAGAEPFARWVYESPSRCPGIRLVYETHHRFRRDRMARPGASDIIDLARVTAVPYVDYFIADAAMMTYCRQAGKEIGQAYPQVLGNLHDVLSHLGIE